MDFTVVRHYSSGQLKNDAKMQTGEEISPPVVVHTTFYFAVLLLRISCQTLSQSALTD